ncbi:serine hydrolase domain-containing protein [Phenylobacterium soli]|uniref:Serine hydrolase n=1 Tax=Phenylobacterium soli TaxID=2170551 RepID=A0A328AJ16_9CAUL|nr:serine hydrolase domain-containing protein [Phenylobacterium soli]RAK54609.1 serine hydrolase [Phenylobacterium soli]
MRSILPATVAALAVLLGAPRAGAQDEAPPLPSHPIPYSQLKPKAAKPKPKPATASPAASTTPAAIAPSGPAALPPTPPQAPAAAPPQAEAGARLAPGQPLPVGELDGFVDGYVRAAMAQAHIAGVTVSVVQNGQVVMKRGYGFASLSPARRVDPDRTLFRIGSISKTFTWLEVLKQAEAGRLRLDQPVNAYLPEPLRVKDQGFDRPVRILDLMDHAPGFEDRSLGHLFEDRFERVRPLDLYLRQERPKRVRPPGQLSSYSNYGAALAGEAAANVARKPYEQLVEDDILGPAGMAHTTFREPHAAKAGLPAPMPAGLAADVSQGFRWTGGGLKARPYEFIEQVAPAGAASSTAGDMARYMLLLLGDGALDGATIYGPATAHAIRAPIQATASGVNGWAHGFVVYSLPGGQTGYGHDGGTLSFFSNMVVVPSLNLGVFVSTNTEGGAQLASRLAPAIVRHFYAPPETAPRAGSPELAGEAATFTGHYVSTRRAYSGLEGLVMRLGPGGVDVRVTPDGRLLLSSFGQSTAWVPDGAPSGGRFVSLDGERRLDVRMKDGRAVAIVPDANAAAYEREPGWKSPGTLALMAALTGLAALLTLIGLAFRNRRDLRENLTQSRASIVQNIQAGLWLLAMVLFGAFFSHAAGDLAWLMYGWPNPSLILGSACALVAAVLTLVTIAALPAVWSGGRRVDSWSYGRKAAFTLTVIVYAAFSILLATWGALSPWSG